MTLDPQHVAWCRRLFESLNEGGVWGVPRSGLQFRRRDDKLVLTQRMPHDKKMSMSEGELQEYQHQDYLDIKEHFEAAGIPVSSELAPDMDRFGYGLRKH